VGPFFNEIETTSLTSTLWSVISKEKVITDRMNSTADFICLQEVFDSRAAKHLLKGLRKKYPYIIYDVSQPLHHCRISLLGSGLCMGSRFPFLDICFKPFPDGHRDDKLACKGLLMAKVYLGVGAKGKDHVGFLATTHLQAWTNEGASRARRKQLKCISQWLEEFYLNAAKNDSSSQEVVVFNILTGDLNFDNVSECDREEQQSDVMQKFRDPCIDEKSGKHHSWAIGTELNNKRIHDAAVRTPHGLQKMLVSELERHQYVASTIASKDCNSSAAPRDNRDGKRKIDHILYRATTDFTFNVQDFKFFTGLTTLTDHLPIGMNFTCEPVNHFSSSCSSSS
jgi:sphingomyelin phosphodiesterase 3